MKKQVIYLLESITSCEINNFTVNFNQDLFTSTYPLIPKVLKKGRESSFYVRLKNPLPSEEIAKQQIQV
jgi:hypothetical protein